ncbi:MAG: hypothetical protein Q8R40_01735 [bacterium]|nr:hypothetical protein [bacterium]
MSLIEFQKIILKTYTNEKFQKRFLADRNGILDNLPLTQRERNALIELSEEDLGFFYHELFEKRHQFMTAILQKSKTNPVLVSSFYVSSPVMAFMANGKKQIVTINEGTFLILEHIAKPNISIKNIINACVFSHGVGMRDVLIIIILVVRHRLMGRNVKIL